MRRALGLLVLLLLLGSIVPPSVTLAGPGLLPGKVAFVRFGDLWLWEAGKEQRITDGGGVTNPRFSHDGRYLAFNQAGSLWVALPGSAPWKVAAATSPADWSPADNTLTFDHEATVYTVRMTGEGPQPPRLVAKGWAGPAWSPDGRYLAVARNTSREKFTGTTEIGLVSPAGGEPRVVWQGDYLQDDWVGPAAELTWSADGKWLAFYRCALTASISMDQNQLNVLAVRGGEVTGIGFGPVNRAYFAWAPTGATLAFTDGGGRFAWNNKQIKVISPPQKAVQTPTAAGRADREPAWSPGGQDLYFIRSVAMAPEKMFQPAREQAIWRLTLATGHQQAVAGTEEALGVRVGRSGQLMWPKGDGKTASLWTTGPEGPVAVVKQLDFAHWYYGQFYWDAIFDWWSQ